MKNYKSKKKNYDSRCVFGLVGLWYKIIILIGARGYGKTYATQNYCLRQFFKKGRKTLWLRLKEPPCKALLSNNAKDFLDSKLIRKWRITGLMTKGSEVWITRGDPEDKNSYREFAKIMPLSTFYSSKGVALNKDGSKKNRKPGEADMALEVRKYYNIVLDEMNAEKSEKKTFDITYAFVNQIETVCRNDLDRRIIMTGNTLDEGSELLSRCFDFVPETFGIYKLFKKRTIIHYMDASEEYKEEKKNSFAGILLGDASTFTNKVEFRDQDLIAGKDSKPVQTVIRFSDIVYFTLTDGVISHKKVPKDAKVHTIALRPMLGGLPYNKTEADDFINRVFMRLFKFDTRKNLVKFKSEIELLKGIK